MRSEPRNRLWLLAEKKKWDRALQTDRQTDRPTNDATSDRPKNHNTAAQDWRKLSILVSFRMISVRVLRGVFDLSLGLRVGLLQ